MRALTNNTISKGIIFCVLIFSSVAIQAFDFAKGWNLKGATNDITDVSSLYDQSCVDEIFIYKNNLWSKYSEGGFNSISAADGFWLHSNADCKVELSYANTSLDIADWTELTHTKNIEPNFGEVFSDDEVKRLDLVVTPARWQSMLDKMTEIYGEFGEQKDRMPPFGEGGDRNFSDFGNRPDFGGKEGNFSDFGINVPAFGNGEDPIFVPADLFYKGKQWYSVGIRFKGNSSLQGSWSRGVLKISFKLDFDEFEQEYPQIKNQRFYGFKKFSLKNNYNDKSFLKEKVVANIFKDAGLAVSNTAFYRLYVDYGQGAQYFGLYTLVEEVDDSVIDTQFASGKGNLYKPDGAGASFSKGTFSKENFVKKNNKDEDDYSDIQALFSALHADTHATNPSAWRANLESVFDVDVFLRYLAINGAVQNWDTYGKMAHNYYLYNNPASGKLTWIPWDNNEALKDGMQREEFGADPLEMGAERPPPWENNASAPAMFGGEPGGMDLGALDLNFSNLANEQWPLISKLYANPVYKERYDEYLQETIDGIFNENTIKAKYQNYADLIQPYATSEREGFTFLENSTDFSEAIETLKKHAQERTQAVQEYLAQ